MADNNNKQSNFDFLTEHWAFLLDDARQVEGYALRDRQGEGETVRSRGWPGPWRKCRGLSGTIPAESRAAAIFGRRTLERSHKWLFANDTALKAPYEKNLAFIRRVTA